MKIRRIPADSVPPSMTWQDALRAAKAYWRAKRQQFNKDSKMEEQATYVTREDVVNHPSHYTQHPSGVECIDIAEEYGFNLGNVLKYVWRAGLKYSDPLTDLMKARFYLEREIQRIKKGRGE